MADQKGNSPPPLLLCSTNDSITPGIFRPVPATASLFPTDEDGEADSFLGQNDPPDLQIGAPPPPASTQQAAPSTFSYFQQQQPLASSGAPPPSDPFAGISTQSGSTFAPPQATSLAGPATIPTFTPSNQFTSPPSLQTSQAPPQGAPFTAPQNIPPQRSRGVHFQDDPSAGPPPPSTTSYAPNAPPPTGPPPTGQAGPKYGIKNFQHKPMAYPMGGVTPASGPLPPGILTPPPKLQQYDASRPPPTASEVQQHSQSSPATPPRAGANYQPIQPHWFYCKQMEKRSIWVPFSIIDSIKLEEAMLRAQATPDSNIIISTNGGRYDVSLSERLRFAIYWDEQPSPVRRCTWFYKSDSENRFIPYEEQMANMLEEEYRTASMQNQWHRRLELSDGETIIMHNPNVIVHFRPSTRPDEWGASPDTQMRPRVVKRGVDDIDSIQQGESSQVDSLVFVIHGIGPVCDLRFRTITECVDDFRSLSLGLMTSHFKKAQEEGRAGRVEFLPVYWYAALHGDATGVDRRLKRITLPSINRLRNFTNETLLDILFYTSPIYAQQIAEVVCSEINKLYAKFKERNPDFCGQVSLIGHSLGSLIAFDLLKHQKDGNEDESEENLVKSEIISDKPPTPAPSVESITPSSSSASLLSGAILDDGPAVMTLEESLESMGLLDLLPKFEEERIDMESLLMCSDADLKEMGIPLGPRKKLGGFLRDQTAKEAKRKESLLQQQEQMKAEQRKAVEEDKPEVQSSPAVVQPSRDGLHAAMSVHVDYEPGLEGVGQPFVNYPQLDFQPACFFALGSPIGMFLTIRGVGRVGENYRLPTCPYMFNVFHPFDPVAYRIEPLIHPTLADIKPVLMPHHKGRKRLHLELRESLSHFGSDLKRSLIESMKKTWNTLHQFALAHRTEEESDETDSSKVTDEQMEAVAEQLSKQQLANQQAEAEGQSTQQEENLRLGQLNGGKRIDYVLQEAPLESFNEYLFAMSSHACYWESEDTVLLVLKEVYDVLGVYPSVAGPKSDSTPSTPLRY